MTIDLLVGPGDRAVPDAGPRLQRHGPDHHGGRGDERLLVDLRRTEVQFRDVVFPPCPGLRSRASSSLPRSLADEAWREGPGRQGSGPRDGVPGDPRGGVEARTNCSRALSASTGGGAGGIDTEQQVDARRHLRRWSGRRNRPATARVDAAVLGQAAGDPTGHPVGTAAAELGRWNGPADGCCYVGWSRGGVGAMGSSCGKPRDPSAAGPSGNPRILP